MMRGVFGGPEGATVVCLALHRRMRGVQLPPTINGALGSPAPTAAIGGSATPVGGAMAVGGHGAAGGATRAGMTRIGTTRGAVPTERSL
eukprot:802749-Alexandrium_andersonii.AAC.1